MTLRAGSSAFQGRFGMRLESWGVVLYLLGMILAVQMSEVWKYAH